MAPKRRYNTETFNAKLKELGRNDLVLLDEYTNGHKNHLFRCTRCQNEWKACPAHVLKRGYCCKKCAAKRHSEHLTLSHEEVQARVGAVIKLLAYKGMLCKADLECMTCGHTWSRTAGDQVRVQTCPQCQRKVWIESQQARRTSDEEFRRQLADTHPNIELVDEYERSGDQHTFRCTIHNHEFTALPLNVLSQVSACPECVQYGFTVAKPAWMYLMERPRPFPQSRSAVVLHPA